MTCDFWAENAKNKCAGENNSKDKGNRFSGFAAAFAQDDRSLCEFERKQATARATAKAKCGGSPLRSE